MDEAGVPLAQDLVKKTKAFDFVWSLMQPAFASPGDCELILRLWRRICFWKEQTSSLAAPMLPAMQKASARWLLAIPYSWRVRFVM